MSDKRKTTRTIKEPHGETKYLKGPDGQVLRYRVTSGKLTIPGTHRDALLARVEADVLARNESEPVDMYAWARATFEDGGESDQLVRLRFDDEWIVTGTWVVD